MSACTDAGLFSDRMRIAARPEKLEKFSEEHAVFYTKYASFVFKTLRKASFQRFLGWMLRKENIEEQKVTDVQVRVLPFKRKNGNGLAGNCNADRGKIQIYPRTMKFCRKLIQEFGKDGFISYVKSRARTALIHELLHLKYAKNEPKVRELTKGYFAIFARNQRTYNSQVASVHRMIFEPVIVENVPNGRVNAPVVSGSQVSSGNMG